MKRILTTTALAALLATPLAAEGENTADWTDTFRDMPAENQIHASEFIGARVYVSESDVTETTINDAGADWEDIGEISDVLLSRDGKLDSILVDIGGFLGVGEKTVAVQMDRLNLVSDGDAPDEYFVVFSANRAALENAPAFQDHGNMSEMAKTGDMNDSEQPMDQTATLGTDAGITDTGMTDAERPVDGYPAAPEMELDGYQTVIVDDLKAETLTGAAVYDARNDWIGEVSNLIVDSDGRVTDAVIDVGGFLGIGEKPVKVGFDSLTLKQSGDAGDLRVFIDVTEEQLEKMPEFED